MEKEGQIIFMVYQNYASNAGDQDELVLKLEYSSNLATYLDYHIIPPSRNCFATLVILDKIKYKVNQTS